MKFIKISLAIVAVLLLLMAVAAGIFVATFDANDYRPQISEQVRQQTGREFSIEDIKPSVFPWVGMELQQIQLANADGFAEKQMLTIERLDVKVELLPLIRQQIHIDTLRIHGLNMSLEKNRQGKTNWDDIVAKQSADTAAPKTVEPAEKSKQPAVEKEDEKQSPLAALLVNGIDIRNANIAWTDAMQNQQAALQQFNLTTGEFQLGQLLPVKMNTRVELSQPQSRFDIELNTQLDFNPQTQLLNIPELLLEVIAQGEVIPQGKMDIQLKTRANVDLQKQIAEVPELTLQALGLTIRANADISELQSAAKVKAHVELLPFDANKLSQALAIELPPMQNENALKQMAIKFDVQASEKSVTLKPLMLQLDASTINGMLSVSQFDKPAIRYELTLDQINVDDYLPPPVEPVDVKGDSAAGASAPETTDTAIELPVDLIRGLNINGQFNAGQLQASGYTLKELNITTTVYKGVASVTPITAQLLEGSIDASVKLDVTKDIPAYSMKLDAAGVKADSVITPVLQDLSGEKEVAMSGASDLNINVNSRGQSVKSLMAASNGNLKLNVGEAVLHGVDAEYFVRKAVTGYLQDKNQQVPETWKGVYQPKQTSALKTARATATITNGVIDNRDLLLESSRFKITGAGQVMLPVEKIDYRLVVDLNPANAKTAAERLLDVPVPVKVKGNFTAPVIDIERSAWIKNIGGSLAAEKKKQVTQAIEQKKQQKAEEVNKKVEEKKQEVKSKMEDAVKDKLKGLFGR